MEAPVSANGTVRLMFLGGLHEVGKNMAALECGDDIIVIDCGLGFPELEQPGIEVVLPDISWLRRHRQRIRGMFITHGHEDHIGAIPYLLADLGNPPIHASRLTMALIAVKLDEAGLLANADLHEFDPDHDEKIPAGVFAVTPFRVCHSIPDACGLGVDTPAGLIVFTGDFKFDPTPVDNRQADLARLQAFGDRGVRLLVSDCVHVESPGMTRSERVVGETFDQVVLNAPGRVIVATFASLISRVQQLVDVASKHGRNVVVFGRSLERNVAMARELGFLNDPDRVVISARDATNLPDHRLIYVITGSQGEPMAVLSRVASNEHRDIRVHENDTVIISASPIPGNETAVFRIIDRLFRLGANVIYPQRALVHVSGHGSQEDLLRMLELTRPRHVIPSHGEARHMALYADLAMGFGIPQENITFTEIGEVLEISRDSVTPDGKVDTGSIYLESKGAEAVSELTLRDRRFLSNDGVILISVAIDPETGRVVGGPLVTARGVTERATNQPMLDGLRDHLAAALGDGDIGAAGNPGYLVRRIRELALSHLGRASRRRPVVVPQVIEVDSNW
jgi:ribonuclease J